MDSSRRSGARQSVPTASRLTIKRGKNRRKPESLWARMPTPHAVGCACGRMLRRSVPAIAATIALFAVGMAVWGAHRFVTTSPRFAIRSIDVHGNARLSDAEIRAVLPVELGQNVFSANLDQLAANVRKLPWVAAASVHRILPNEIVVDIREYEPAAIVVLDESYLVDAHGTPFKRAQLDRGEGADLPVITGLDRSSYRRDPRGTSQTIVAALGALADWQRGTRPQIGEVHIDARGGLTLRTYDLGTSVQLGSLGPELVARMQTFDAAWAELSPSERELARAVHLDARNDHVTIAFKTGAAGRTDI